MKTPPSSSILLAGFSGAGKSTVLAALAERLPTKVCLDLDTLVSAGRASVAEMIKTDGWEAFRAKELSQLERVLNRETPAILALGGGTLMQGWALIEKYPTVQVVHLDCPFEVCWDRLTHDEVERPLALAGKEAMRKLFEERKPLYERCKLRVDARGSADDVALAILRITGLA